MASHHEPSADFFNRQRTLLGASALLVRDEREYLLLVKPLYKDVWHLPGGMMESEESPRAAAERETKEEVGLDLSAGRLLVVDYKSATPERPACVQFVFSCGLIGSDQLNRIVLQTNEIESWRLVPGEEALTMVAPGGPSSRLFHAIRALDSDVPACLEDGHPF